MLPDNIKIISYEDALSRARQPGGKWHVLLGNGFSIGAHEQFRYGTLYEQALDAGLPEHVQILFDRYGTANFEEVLRQLDEGMWFARHYKLKATSRERVMKVDYDALKAALTKAIAQIHPPARRAVDSAKMETCADFIAQFHDVFTTNYDLLLYWASLAKSPFPFEDGFLREGNADFCVFVSPSNQTRRIYFLHGALHLYSAEGEVRKRVWNSTQVLLVDQVREALERREYPLVVSEGKAIKKKERIEGSSYLSWCHQKFEEAEGSLFTYGSSLAKEDEHLWKSVVENRALTTLYVGLHGDVESATTQGLVKRARRLGERRVELRSKRRWRGAPALEVLFFDSETAPVWDAGKN